MTDKNVFACIAAVSKEIAQTGISKSRNNTQQGYKFRGIDDVYNAIAPLLAKHGLVIIPRILTRNVVERQTAKGGTLFYVTVEAEFDFVSAFDGSKTTARSFGEAMDTADKATNKAMSAAYKYTAFQTFCIPTEGDNDADGTTHEVKAEAPKGYDEWMKALTTAAAKGTDELRTVYGRENAKPFRQHLAATNPASWEDLKTMASDVDKAVPA